MEKALTISFIITAIYMSLQPDMIFSKIRYQLEKFPLYLHKPLYECLTCMGGFYSLILYPILYGSFDLKTIITMLMVIGINTIISALIQRLND